MHRNAHMATPRPPTQPDRPDSGDTSTALPVAHRRDISRRTRTHFVTAATSAVWDGDLLTVTFREVGLPAGATTTVTVTGNVTAEATYRVDDGLCTLSSEAVATDEAVYPVDADGTTQGMVVLQLATHLTAGGGNRPRPTTRRSFMTTIRDPGTGAAAYLSGPASPTTPPTAQWPFASTGRVRVDRTLRHDG